MTAVAEKPVVAVAQKGGLLSAVSRAARAASTRSHVSILEHLHLSLESGTLTITGCDGARWISTVCPMAGDGFVACAHALKLKSAIELSPDGDIEVTLNAKTLRVKCGAYSASLPIIEAEDFPPMPHVEGDALCLPFGVLRDAIGAVRHSVYSDKHRDTLMGICISPEGDGVEFASTDTHHASRYAVPGSVERERILRDTMADEIAAFRLADSDTCAVVFSTRLCRASDGFTSVVASSIEGPYCNYRRVFPVDSPRKWTVSAEELTLAISRCSKIAAETCGRILLETDGGRLKVSARSDPSQVEDSVDAECENIDGFRIACDYKLLVPTIKGFDGAVTLGMTEHSRPIVACHDSRPGWIGIVMPLALS